MQNEQQKVKAFDLFLKQVEKDIENEIPEWLSQNPYWEIDGDDGLPAHCPPTNEADARASLCENFVNQGDNLGYGDFFEYVIYLIYGEPMSKKNVFRKNNSDQASTETDYLVKIQKEMLDNLFFPDGVKFPEIKKTTGVNNETI